MNREPVDPWRCSKCRNRTDFPVEICEICDAEARGHAAGRSEAMEDVARWHDERARAFTEAEMFAHAVDEMELASTIRAGRVPKAGG